MCPRCWLPRRSWWLDHNQCHSLFLCRAAEHGLIDLPQDIAFAMPTNTRDFLGAETGGLRAPPSATAGPVRIILSRYKIRALCRIRHIPET
jgi:hypothetical protein